MAIKPKWVLYSGWLPEIWGSGFLFFSLSSVSLAETLGVIHFYRQKSPFFRWPWGHAAQSWIFSNWFYLAFFFGTVLSGILKRGLWIFFEAFGWVEPQGIGGEKWLNSCFFLDGILKGVGV